MKKLKYLIFTLAAILAMTSSCTQNGGHIGDIFGRWHLLRIEADNMEAPAQNGDLFWAFQGDMFEMQLSHGNHDCYLPPHGRHLADLLSAEMVRRPPLLRSVDKAPGYAAATPEMVKNPPA